MNASEATVETRRWGSWGVSLVLAVAVLGLAGRPAAAKDSSRKDVAEQLAFGAKMAQQGLWSEALFRFRQAERLEPGNVRAMNNVAVALEATGKFEDALAAYQKALKADPTNVELKRNYGRFVEFYQSFKSKPKPDAVLVPTKPNGGAR